MRKPALFILGSLIVAAAGFYFGYPAYVKGVVVDDLARMNAENEWQNLTVADLTVDPWTSTLTASELTLVNPAYDAVMQNVTVKAASFLLFTPITTINAFEAENITLNEAATGNVVTAARMTLTDTNIEAALAAGGLQNISQDQILELVNVQAFAMENGTIADPRSGNGTFDRIALTGLKNGFVEEMRADGMTFSDGEFDAVFGSMVMRGLDLADIHLIAYGPGNSPSETDEANSATDTVEMEEFTFSEAKIVPKDDALDSISFDRVSMKSFLYKAAGDEVRDQASELESVEIGVIEMDGFLAEDEEKLGLKIGKTAIHNMSGGVLGSLALEDFDVDAEGRKIKLGSFKIDDVKFSQLLRLSENSNVPNAPQPSAAAVLQALVFGGFDAAGLNIEAEDGSVSKVDKVSLRDLAYYKGMPVSAKLTMEGTYQSVSKESLETELEKVIGPIVFDLPTESLSSGELDYRMDMDTGVLTLTSGSTDSVNGMSSLFDLRMSGLKSVFEAIADENPQLAQFLPEIALEKVIIEIDTGAEWPVPQLVDGIPTVRMFVIGQLDQIPPQMLQQSEFIVSPIRAFMAEGGRFRIALEPPQPFPVLQMQMLPMVPPQQAIEAIGLTAIHE